MRFLKFCLAYFLVAGCCAAPSFAQTSQWYFGTGIGAQQWRGPLNANFGMGGEILLGRTYSGYGAFVLTAGYASLPFQQSSLQNGVKFTLVTREANLFHGDMLFELHPLGRHTFSPYVALGGGLLNVQVGSATRKNYPAGIIAGGLQLRVNKDLVFHLAGKYHHVIEEALAGFDPGKTPEGYFGARVGLIFSSSPNKNETEADWFTILDAETSPFAEQPKPEAASHTAPAETSAVKTEAPLEQAVEENFETEENESAFAQVEAPPSLSEVPAPALDTAAVPAHANHADENDPFSRFNRKLEMLEKESTAPPASPNPVEALLEDEPPFESFYPGDKSQATQAPQPRLFEKEEKLDAEQSSGAVSVFEERLAKLDEQEDFLSPGTPLVDAPVETLRSDDDAADTSNEAQPAEAVVSAQSEPLPEREDAPVPGGLLESRLRALDERFESAPEISEPQPRPHEEQAPAAAQTPLARAHAPTPSNALGAAETHKAPAPVERMTRAPAPPQPATRAPSPLPSSQPQRKPAAPQPAEDQELRELRALLDRLEGGASHSQSGYDATRGLAVRSDRELAELRLRLDELTAGERYAQQSAPPDAGRGEGKNAQAYEAFKDRLGLMEESPKTYEDEDWDQQRLKSQINNIDKELAQKEQDLAAIRTALAQSAANGAAFTASPTIVRGSFAQGYEGALNSFYMQRYAEAIGKFSRLIEQYPAHTLTSNCYYWLGEAQYGHGDYQAALVSFQRVLAFERSLKKDNALLMLGKTYMALQRPTDARAAFNRLTSEYPFSDAVNKAQELMKNM